MIIAQMATMPQRRSTLIKAFNSLINQVDEFHINPCYDEDDGTLWFPPEILVHDKVRVMFHDNSLQDGSKFFNAPEQTGRFVVVVDDDIEYPDNFVESMVQWLRFNDGGIVSCMGKILNRRPIKSFFKDETFCYHTFGYVQTGGPVEIPGTCAMVYHTDDLVITTKDMICPNSDIAVGILANKLKIQCWVRPHLADWLKNLMPEIPNSPSMFDKYKKDDRVLTEFVNKYL